MRVVVVALGLLVAALAGCSGKEADVAGALEAASDDVDAKAAVNVTVNTAPTATLAADVLNGTAPLNVTFTLAGADADKDNLTWMLTAGNATLGNGTTLPANVTHQFLEAGNVSVVLAVSDGSNTTLANVTIVVAAAVPAVTGPVICEAEGETELPGGFYQDRMSWIFEESNGLPGLQYTAEPSLIGEYDSAGEGCENGDTLLF